MADGLLSRVGKAIQPIPKGFARLPSGRLVPVNELRTKADIDFQLKLDAEEGRVKQSNAKREKAKAKKEAEAARLYPEPEKREYTPEELRASTYDLNKAKMVETRRHLVTGEIQDTLGLTVTKGGNRLYDTWTDIGSEKGGWLGGHLAGLAGMVAQAPATVVGGVLQALDPTSTKEEAATGLVEAGAEVVGGKVAEAATKPLMTAGRRILENIGIRTGRRALDEVSEAAVGKAFGEHIAPARAEVPKPKSLVELVERVENPHPPEGVAPKAAAAQIEPAARPRTLTELVDQIEAKPVEDPSTSPGTAAANASTAQVRERMGLGDAPETTPENFARWTHDERSRKAGEDHRLLVQEVEAGKRLDRHETIGLAGKLDELDQQYARVTKSLDEARAEGDFERARLLEAHRESLREDGQAIADALKQSGTEQARDFAARKAIVREDYSLAGLLRQAEANAGKRLNPRQTAEIEGLTKRLEEAEAKLAAQETGEMAESIKVKKSPPMKREELDKELDELFKELGKATAKLSSGIDPEALAIVGKIAVNRVRYGVASIEELVQHVKQAFRDRGLSEPTDEDILRAYNEARPRRTQKEISIEVKERRAALAKLNREIDDLLSGKTAEREAKAKTRAEQKRETATARQAERQEAATNRAKRRAGETEARKAAQEEQKALLDARKPYERQLQRRADLEAEIADLERQLTTGEYQPPKTKRQVMQDRQTERLRAQRDLVKAEVKKRMETLRKEAEYRSMPMLRRATAYMWRNVSSAQRAFQTAFDVGYVGIQGRKVLYSNPKAWWAGVKDSMQVFKSGSFEIKGKRYGIGDTETTDEIAQRLFNDVKADPNYEVARKHGVIFDNTDEFFGSAEISNAPGIGKSNAMMGAFLNRTRLEAFKAYARNGGDKAFLESAADIVNILTGKPVGKFGEAARKVGGTFYAPGYEVSKWQYNLFVPIARAMKRGGIKAAAPALQAYASNAVVTFGLMGVAEALGADVEFDPRSANFGTVKIGNVRIDLFGTNKDYSPIRTLAQQFWGNISAKGEYRQADEYGEAPIQRYVESKLAPLPKTIYSALRTGTKYNYKTGEEEIISAKGVAEDAAPMGLKSIHDEWPKIGPWSLFEVLGVNAREDKVNPDPEKPAPPFGLPTGIRRLNGELEQKPKKPKRKR